MVQDDDEVPTPTMPHLWLTACPMTKGKEKQRVSGCWIYCYRSARANSLIMLLTENSLDLDSYPFT
jgi:hypothetical protein